MNFGIVYCPFNDSLKNFNFDFLAQIKQYLNPSQKEDWESSERKVFLSFGMDFKFWRRLNLRFGVNQFNIEYVRNYPYEEHPFQFTYGIGYQFPVKIFNRNSFFSIRLWKSYRKFFK